MYWKTICSQVESWPRFTSFYCFFILRSLKFFLFFAGKVGGLTDLSNMIEVDGVGHHQFGSLVGGSSSGASTPDRGSAPQWTVQPANEVSFSNSTGSKLECMASGKPLPTIEWFQEDELIAQNLHGLRMVMPNGSLIFPAFT